MKIQDITQGVAEAFDKPYRSKTEKSESSSFDVLAKLPDGTNLSIMFNNEGNDDWQVEFYRNNSQEVTGEGDAQRIFATVLNAIQKFITKHKPAHLSFAASKETDPSIVYEPDEPQPNPASRAKLYDRLVQRYAKSWGYRAFRADNGHIVMYELSRINKQGVAEDKDPCWDNYKQIGMKEKNGKKVPNCVPESLDEIDRRGFLRGMGAAAVAGAAGSAVAAPFRHNKNVDPMTGKENGKYSEVRSDNSNAVLSIQWPEHKWPGVFIDIPRGIINFGVYGASGRIKINGKVADVYLSRLSNGSYSSASIDIPPRTVLTATGDLWVEVPIYNDGNRVFKFTIEPDSITKAIPAPAPKKPEVKKDKPEDVKKSVLDRMQDMAKPEQQSPEDMRQSNLDRMSGNSSPSASYAGRIIARIKPNITFTDDVQGNPKAEVKVRAAPDGTIVSRKLLSSSGNRSWDEAVLRAIDKTALLPRDVDGRVPSTIIISFRPQD